MIQSMFGENDDAIAALERGFEERADWMYTLPVQTYYRGLRAIRGFSRSLKKCGMRVRREDASSVSFTRRRAAWLQRFVSGGAWEKNAKGYS